MIDPDSNAFPSKSSDGSVSSGLTKREYIATQIFASLLTSEKYNRGYGDETAKEAISFADALIAQLNKNLTENLPKR
jgi:hypothetical protein